MSLPRRYGEYLALRGLVGVLNFLPLEASTWIAHRVADLTFDVLLTKRRKTALKNLDRAFGDTLSVEEKTRIARESMRSIVTSLFELFRLPLLIREAAERFIIEDADNARKVFEKRKGLILVISHIGSWETLGLLPWMEKFHCSVVVRESRNPFLDHWVNRCRSSTGLVPVNRKASMKPMLRELKANHLVAILIDQWAGPDGVWMDFFGTPTSVTDIPARLAQRTGAGLVPACCLRTATGHYKIKIYPEISFEADAENPVLATTRKLNQHLEGLIREYPGQWAWSHRRWKEKGRHNSRTAAEETPSSQPG